MFSSKTKIIWLSSGSVIRKFGDCHTVYGMVPSILRPRSEKQKSSEGEGLEFKVLLIINSASGLFESVCYENETQKVVFLPPNKISLLQP